MNTGCFTLPHASLVGKIIQSSVGTNVIWAVLSARKLLLVEKSTCKDLLQWASHRYDDSIAGRQSVA